MIGACIEVHRHLGPGLLESAYEECLAYELVSRGIRFERQVRLPVRYKGIELECGYRIDLVVEAELIVELKAVEQLLPLHQTQLLTHLKLSGISTGLLVNFHSESIQSGLRRLTYHPKNSSPASLAPC